MADIVLATLNARYIHCAFGLRYLLANMGDLQSRTALLEFTIQQPTLEVLAAILEQNPRIVGLGIYIWNIEETTRLVADLKRLRPDVHVVLGGPEVSYETDDLAIAALADRIITGEADLAFAAYCRHHLNESSVIDNTLMSMPIAGDTTRSIAAPLPTLNDLRLPYDQYSDADIAHRVIYVEASRGCPFTCEFCLSALDIPVRQFPLEVFLAAMDSLLKRGARQFKFVDRTFNLNIRVGRAILEFFLERYEAGMFFHFEMIPDRLPDALKDLIVRFPAGALQFEVGIQTFNEDVCELISRRQDNDIAERNLAWLRDQTGVHVHADLIVGLPGESLASFAVGFDRLVRLAPQEIQVGILKRLRGTPIVRHDLQWSMIYSPHPPYEILANRDLPFEAVQELRRFAKYWDAIANSGNFVESLPLIWGPPDNNDLLAKNESSPFKEFQRLTMWIFEKEQKTHGIPLTRLIELVFHYLTEEKEYSPEHVVAVIWRDYQRGGRSDKPHCLRPYLDAANAAPSRSRTATDSRGPKRQARHWVGQGEADSSSG